MSKELFFVLLALVCIAPVAVYNIVLAMLFIALIAMLGLKALFKKED